MSSPALAKGWYRAESEHYVVHGQLSERDLRTLAQSLEEFHRLLEQQMPTDAQVGRKLQIYLDRGTERIEWATKMDVSGVTTAGAEFAGSFSRYDRKDERHFRESAVNFSQASYYIRSSYFRTMPTWFRTGAPAVFKTSYRNDKGQFVLGVPDVRNPRVYPVSERILKEVLTTETHSRNSNSYQRFYRRSREMVRPLMLDSRFSGKLDSYLANLTEGGSLESAMSELGDLDALVTTIREFSGTTQPTIRLVTLEPSAPAAVNVRAMREDEEEVVAYRFARLIGARPEAAAKRLKNVTKRFPTSAEVWFEYAAAEYALVRNSLFGGEPVFRGFGFSNGQIIVSANAYSDAIAWAAVKRALELDPSHAPAKVLKAEILLSRLLRSNETDETSGFQEVRALIRDLASLPEAYPLAAAVDYQSYLEQEIEPPQEAMDRLGRAFVANRGVGEFRYAYASALARVGQTDAAEVLLKAMLSNPKYRDAARDALTQTRSQ
ncbi:MAG: hypothetical protein AAF251_16765 [Pseudomonadota bacterium]